jgi:ELWxxDGT repeat protein
VIGSELWKSDGTAEGTVRVEDINPGGDSYPSELTAVGNTLYFVAEDGSSGRELWQTDGTALGTALVQDLAPGAGSSAPYHMMASNGRLFFGAYMPDTGAELYMLDMADLRYTIYLPSVMR